MKLVKSVHQYVPTELMYFVSPLMFRNSELNLADCVCDSCFEFSMAFKRLHSLVSFTIHDHLH